MIDVVQRELVVLQRLVDHLRKPHHGVLEDETPLHAGEDPPVVDHLPGDPGRVITAGRRFHPQRACIAPIGVEVSREDSPILVGGLDDHGGGPVPEEHGYVPATGGHVDPGGMDLGSHHEDAPVDARANETVGHAQRVEKAAALAANIHGRDPRETEPIVQERRGARKIMIGREGREDDHLDVVVGESRRADRLLGSNGGHVTSALSVGRPVTGADPRALLDPLVGRVHAARQLVIGHAAIGDVPAGSGDSGVGHGSSVKITRSRVRREAFFQGGRAHQRTMLAPQVNPDPKPARRR